MHFLRIRTVHRIVSHVPVYGTRAISRLFSLVTNLTRSLSLSRYLGAVFWKFGPVWCYVGGAALMAVPLLRTHRLRSALDKKRA